MICGSAAISRVLMPLPMITASAALADDSVALRLHDDAVHRGDRRLRG